jgi:hypothetical protein
LGSTAISYCLSVLLLLWRVYHTATRFAGS